MNRYQLEVAELDRKHHLMVRALSFGGAAFIIIVALWSADFSPTGWLSAVRTWLGSPAEQEASADVDSGSEESTATRATPYQPLVDDLATRGTDASVSLVPLQLLLVDTSPGRNKHEGTARIGTSSENPQTYAAGALLANGATLAEVHESYVILEQGDRKVRLDIGVRQGRVSDPLLFVGERQAPDASKPSTADPLVEILRPSPVFEANQVVGIEVFPGRNGALFSQLGLRPGDVLVSINGAPIVDMKSALDLLREVTNGVALGAAVRRNGALASVNLDGTIVLAEQERASMADANAQVGPSL